MKVFKTIGFWFVQCTWGFIMTFIGAIVTLSLIVTGKKPQHLGPVVYVQTGQNWGGISLGGFFFCGEDCGLDIKKHEAGHAIQNLIFGPLFPFLIGIPSLIRCMLRERNSRLKKSLFNLYYLITTLIITTCGACIAHYALDLKWLVIFFEALRIYFLLISIWMSAFEIKKYDKGYVDYDAVWFEGQATKLGNKIFK